MKRVLSVLGFAAATLVLSAGSALAQTETYPPSVGPSVEGTSGGGGGTAFTGSDVSFAVLAVVVLVAVGLVALFATRRRSAHAS
jgi:hypothetical protein